MGAQRPANIPLFPIVRGRALLLTALTLTSAAACGAQEEQGFLSAGPCTEVGKRACASDDFVIECFSPAGQDPQWLAIRDCKPGQCIEGACSTDETPQPDAGDTTGLPDAAGDTVGPTVDTMGGVDTGAPDGGAASPGDTTGDVGSSVDVDVSEALDGGPLADSSDPTTDGGSNDSGGGDDVGAGDAGGLADTGGQDDVGESDDVGGDDVGVDDVGSDDAGSDDVGSDDVGSDDVGSDDAGSDDAGSDTQECGPEGCCVPACEGKSCGDDGCGGSCGACPAGLLCVEPGVCGLEGPCPDMEACTVVPPPLFGPGFTIQSLVYSSEAVPGQALDIDPENGPGDCAPKPGCTDGLDNSFSAITKLLGASTAIPNLVKEGTLLLARVEGDLAGTFSLDLYEVTLVDPSCDVALDTCACLVTPESWGCDCKPLGHFDDATLVDGTLRAGGPESWLRFAPTKDADLALLGAAMFHLHRARIEASATLEQGVLRVTDGVLGGALLKQDILDAIAAYPGDTIGSIPKGTVLTLMDGTLKSDIDTDGDGQDDGVSVALKLVGGAGVLAGMGDTPAPCEPTCEGKQCGPDGCGASCGACPVGDVCAAGGQCEALPPEVCWNGQDDDGDLLADCDDDDCSESEECAGMAVTCYAVGTCMVEAGCGCTLGLDCPPEAQQGACRDACAADPSCMDACVAKLPPDTQAAWSEWVSCATSWCSQISDPVASHTCLVEHCLDELTTCYFNGSGDCDQFVSCAVECDEGDDACNAACQAALSKGGAADLYQWTGCYVGLCDADGDGASDSVECNDLAALLACGVEGGTCLPGVSGPKGCKDTTNCVLGCGFSNGATVPCRAACLEDGDPSNDPSLAAAWTCAIAACGTTPLTLTPTCVANALTSGPCTAEGSACGFVVEEVPPCPDGLPAVDTDLDGNPNCWDPDDDGDGASDVEDCAPFDPSVHPGAQETCNGVDDDCDGEADEEVSGGACLTQNELGACEGAVVCVDGSMVCSGQEALPEICDGVDNDCDGLVDESYPDSDLDGLPDCIDDDADDDQVPNGSDNCPTQPNMDQEDLDLDGSGDACDPDLDGDLVPNALDNCPSSYNPKQIDMDGDWLGDECDPTPLGGGDSCADYCGGVAPDGCSCAAGCIAAGDCCGDYVALCCAPDCPGPECGDDGCGGSCGFCDEGMLCAPAGQCVPSDTCLLDAGLCALEPPSVEAPTSLVTWMKLGASGDPGEGLDLDPDNGPEDCAPIPQCSAGIDNGLAALGALLGNGDVLGGKILLSQVAEGPGGTQSVRMYEGASLDVGIPGFTYAYAALTSSWGCDCELLGHFEDATIVDGKLWAGGSTSRFALLGAPSGLALDLRPAWIAADLTPGLAGGLAISGGVIGGAVRKQDLIDGVMALPDDALPVPKETLAAMMEVILVEDLDTDGDGLDDAISVGLKLAAEPAVLFGLQGP